MPRHIIATVTLNKDAFQRSSVKYRGRIGIISSTNSLSQIEQVLISVLLLFLMELPEEFGGFFKYFIVFLKKHKRMQTKKRETKCPRDGVEGKTKSSE